MARNGSGSYSNPYPNFVSGTVISSTQVDANNSDIATALTQSIAVDGQSTVTANLPMNAKKLTGLAVGAAATDSLTLGQAQAEAMVWCGTAGGSANAITLSPTPAITAYAAGQRFVWKASGSVNTGATTVAISGLGAIALQDNGSALAAGQHQANRVFMGILDTTSTVQVTQVQISGTDPLLVTSLTVSGTSLLTGVTTHGGNVVSDTDSTDDLGTSGVRWKELFVDAITATDQVTATGFTGTLDGILGSGSAASASVTTLTVNGDITTTTSGTSNFVAGVNAGNSIASGGNYNVVIGDEAGTAITTGDNNVAVGYAALDANNTGHSNVAVGALALGVNITGTSNVAVGMNALLVNTTGANNTAVGKGALDANTDANYNSAFGERSLSANTTGANNTAVGSLALGANTTASNNTAVGSNALDANVSGVNSTAVGYLALTTNTASNMTAVGYNALGANTTGPSGVAVGYNALGSNTTGASPTAVGLHSLLSNTTGASNTAVGTSSLGGNTTANNNSALGLNALIAVTTGSQNTALGTYAGSTLTTGAYNVYIGYSNQPSAVGVSGEIVVGSGSMTGKGASTGFISPGNGAVYQGNNSTAWTATSDRRIKKDIVPNTKGLAAIVQIEPKNFYYKSDDELQEELPGAIEGLPLNKLTTSAIAQELDLIFPEAIERRGKHDIMSVNTDPIFWSMINAIKELSAKVTELEDKLNV